MPLYRILPGKGEFGARIVKTYELEWGEWVGGERSFLAGKVHSESPGYCTELSLVAPEDKPSGFCSGFHSVAATLDHH